MNIHHPPQPHDYATTIALYRESSGYRDEPLTSRTIEDLVKVTDVDGFPVLQLNTKHEPDLLVGARVTAGADGTYCWHLREVESQPERVALRELRGILRQLHRLDLYRQYEIDIVQADALLKTNRWRLVEAVTGATSVDDLSERLGVLIAE